MHSLKFQPGKVATTVSYPIAVNETQQQALDNARAYRHQQVCKQLAKENADAILLHDPLNIRYASDTSNMQVWTMHNAGRYALVFADGYTLVWEFHGCEHLSVISPLVNEVRSAINWSYFGTGQRAPERADLWAQDLDQVLRQRLGESARLAADKPLHEGGERLLALGHSLVEGEGLMERARRIKSNDELYLMQYTIDVCEKGMQRMYDELTPGMTENEIWAYLHFENIQHGGEWIETRILSSGPRTNPWMQESSNRVMNQGELLGFDTDLIGPFGYCADISRTWTVGHVPPSAKQKQLYQQAWEQIQHNQDLLKSGLSYREFSEKAWPIPEKYYANRYCVQAHGVGLCDETPSIAHQGEDWEAAGYDGVFEENMVICVESYIGEEGGEEGVKLEQQVVITETGCRSMVSFPYQDDWLGY